MINNTQTAHLFVVCSAYSYTSRIELIPAAEIEIGDRALDPRVAGTPGMRFGKLTNEIIVIRYASVDPIQ